MQIEVKGNKEDLSAMLVSAERYALGRQTYIVQWTCEFLANNQHLLTEKDRQVIIRDIKQQGERDFKNPYGWDCDEEEWMKLLKMLKEE